MPVPIRLNNGQSEPSSNEKNIMMDFSILMSDVPEETRMKKVAASDKDAKLLFEIWSEWEKENGDTFKVASSNVNSRDIMRLKTLGFIHGDLDKITFTSKGKTVVCTMALGEPNKFEQIRQEKSYSEILASMDKKNKPGYRTPKYASSTETPVDVSLTNKSEIKNEERELNPTFASHTMLNTFTKNAARNILDYPGAGDIGAPFPESDDSFERYLGGIFERRKDEIMDNAKDWKVLFADLGGPFDSYPEYQLMEEVPYSSFLNKLAKYFAKYYKEDIDKYVAEQMETMKSDPNVNLDPEIYDNDIDEVKKELTEKFVNSIADEVITQFVENMYDSGGVGGEYWDYDDVMDVEAEDRKAREY